MKRLQKLEKDLAALSLDLRVEAVMSELISHGVDVKDIVIKPVGSFRRPYGKDISEISYPDVLTRKKRKLYIGINREGLYDQLPEGLFHQPQIRNPFRSSKDMVEQSKRLRKEDQSAREFFLPLEQEIYKQRIEVENEERELLSSLTNFTNQRMFVDFWQLSEELDSRQRSLFLHLLPMAHRIAGNLQLATQCFSLILNEQVRIEVTAPSIQRIEDPQLLLGQGSLGVDMVIGDHFDDGKNELKVTIGQLTNSRLSDYLFNGKKVRILESLCDYFLPVESQVEMEIVIPVENNQFILSDEETGGYLGYSSVI